MCNKSQTILEEERTEISLPSLAKQAEDAALAGLDFFVRNQYRDPTLQSDDPSDGRFPFAYDRYNDNVVFWSHNWTTAIVVEAMLAGFHYSGREKYIQAAKRGVKYLWSLQEFCPLNPRLMGAFHEVTPQSSMAHPRDALTAAWALWDFGRLTGCEESRRRALLYADWFMRIAMEKGYPYWTVRFDDLPWEPMWLGSFHGGSAFFFYRLYCDTCEVKYLYAMEIILKHFNTYHLDNEGKITVIIDRETGDVLDGIADGRFSNRGWEMMHAYNDDFSSLANLVAYQVTGKMEYLEAAKKFLQRMMLIQRQDGGFGPANVSVPSAGGSVLMELLAARLLGHDWICEDIIDNAVRYLLSIQFRQPGHGGDGAFYGMDAVTYEVNYKEFNLRSTSYAIIGLLRYSGVDSDEVYWPILRNDNN